MRRGFGRSSMASSASTGRRAAQASRSASSTTRKAEKVSILENVEPATAGPAIAALGLSAAIVAVFMARARGRGVLHYPLAGLAWALAALAVVIPDSRLLMALARTPIVLAGMPFGWPDEVGFFEPGMFAWPVANQLLIMLGGALWAGTGSDGAAQTHNITASRAATYTATYRRVR
jgi:hypothetical protein